MCCSSILNVTAVTRNYFTLHCCTYIIIQSTLIHVILQFWLSVRQVDKIHNFSENFNVVLPRSNIKCLLQNWAKILTIFEKNTLEKIGHTATKHQNNYYKPIRQVRTFNISVQLFLVIFSNNGYNNVTILILTRRIIHNF